MDIVNYVGYLGPHILIIMNVYVLLFHYPKHLYLYIPFLFINDILINPALKLLFRQSRPYGYNKVVGIDKGLFTNSYGMPSGHSQSSFFSIMYLWLVTQSGIYLLIGLYIGIITVYQRWRDKRHSIDQLIVGGALGAFFAYTSFMISKKILQ